MVIVACASEFTNLMQLPDEASGRLYDIIHSVCFFNYFIYSCLFLKFINYLMSLF